MKYLIIVLAILALLGGGASYVMWRNNADLRSQVHDAKDAKDAADKNADKWKLLYGQQALHQQQDDKLAATISALGTQLRLSSQKSQQTYQEYLRSKANDKTACENQPVPDAVYQRLGLPVGNKALGPGP